MISSPLLASIPNILHSFGTRDEESPPERLVTSRQVHGTEIYFAKEAGPPAQGGFDILLTDQAGVAVGVKTADCLPVLIVEPGLGVVAAAHAGWRGTLRGVAAKAVTRILELDGHADRLAAALGPSIGPCCYEVGEEVAAALEKELPDFSGQILVRKSEKKWMLDLPLANRLQLMEKGVRPERIDRIDLCTRCRPDLFHSFRRDHEAAGRMVSFIQLL